MMLKQAAARMAGWLWLKLPKGARRAGLLLHESRFTVTAGAVITDEAGRVLLLKHRFRPGGGWGIPGGFLQAREQPDEALRRELREEIGLEITDPRLAFARTLQTYRQVELIFTCQPLGAAAIGNLEIKRSEWFAPDALPQELSDDQRQLIRRALGQKENAKGAQ